MPIEKESTIRDVLVPMNVQSAHGWQLLQYIPEPVHSWQLLLDVLEPLDDARSFPLALMILL